MTRNDKNADKGLERAARLWGDRSAQLGDEDIAKGYFWNDKAVIRRHHNRKISGRDHVDWIDYVAERCLTQRPLERCLSLGCGGGKLERWLVARGVARSVDAYDVSPRSIQVARELAQQNGYSTIHYAVADVNTVALPSSRYDAVWVYHAMHHFRDLEAICERVASSLKPGGVLVLNDYIGPRRFQFAQRQVDVINSCLGLLPERYRRIVPAVGNGSPAGCGVRAPWVERVWNRARQGELFKAAWDRLMRRRTGIDEALLRREFRPPTVRQVLDVDPTEAIRSDDIVAVVRQHFEIVERQDYGGCVLQFLLQDILQNFPDGDAEAEACLRMVITIEDTLVSLGELTSDFAVIVARPFDTTAHIPT